MKNIFRLFSAMLIAGSVMLVSCNPTEEPVPSTPQYTITVSANDPTMGTVTGGGTYDENTTATLTATPNEGYKFVNWNDGNTDNPRTITVTADANYMANFDEADGVKVTFDNETWNATTVLGADYSTYGLIVLEGYKDYERTDTPHISGYTGAARGTYTHAQQDNYYFFYYENDNDFTTDPDGSLSGTAGAQLPNWQPSQGYSCTVTALDLNAHTITATANGSVFSLPQYLQGNQVTKNLTIEFKNATWEVAEKSSKSVNARLVK